MVITIFSSVYTWNTLSTLKEINTLLWAASAVFLMSVRNKYFNKFFIIMTDITDIYALIVLACYMRTWSGTFIDLVPSNHRLSLYLSKWWIPSIIVGSIGYHRGYGIIISFWDDCLVIIKSLLMAFLIVWVVFSLQKEAETVSRSGRSEIDYAKRVKLDYLYMLNWSLWFDMVIILKTFRSILNCKGAY
jgi:hypothetical protein